MKDAFHGHLVNTSADARYTLQRYAIGNAKVHFYLDRIATVARSNLKKCVQGSSDKFEVADGGATGSGRSGHPPLVQGAPILSNAPFGCGFLLAEGKREALAGKGQK